ncbi:hypothetical protein QWY75_06020 [Pontixanthobacter aestiaquae]|uniref:Uncharacterized protein n=1 Tax=Pontixanthobacter aestiaquae TaxID=1509367 RepID=A0A844Z7M6_9SPHN|nr:hypothetical protein [Pontixanthobacter aestiaquae]MDN3645759.1 hypothetical protein [Pontixanthobacter aestiaquae]MXO83246.1 hypothetical protein [Pontixanthobacter aestiaquae]
MQLRFVATLAVFAALACSQPTDVEKNVADFEEKECIEPAVYRFDAVSSDQTDNRRVVIDFKNGDYGTVTQGGPEIFGHVGTGRITNCSTDEFHCLDAGLLFILPKGERVSFELREGLNCKVQAESSRTTVSCFLIDELVWRLRKTEAGVDQIERFFPEEPDFNSVFRSLDQPLPFPPCQPQLDALSTASPFAAE